MHSFRDWAIDPRLTEPLRGGQTQLVDAGQAWPGLARSAVTRPRISLLRMAVALEAMSSAGTLELAAPVRNRTLDKPARALPGGSAGPGTRQVARQGAVVGSRVDDD